VTLTTIAAVFAVCALYRLRERTTLRAVEPSESMVTAFVAVTAVATISKLSAILHP